MNTEAKGNWFNVRRIALGFLVGGFGLFVVTSSLISHWDFESLPKLPDEKTERVNRVFVAGGTRYGTEREVRVLKILDDFRPVACMSLAIAIIVGLAFGHFKIAPGRKLNE